MVYAREVEGQTLSFGVSGKLIMNALVMYDIETDSLWSQFLGEAISGSLKGVTLELIPAQLLSWAAWKEQHPDTLYLETDGFPFDPYLDYYYSNRAGILGEANTDVRLFTKDVIVGVELDGSHKAYAYGDLAVTGVVNDVFEGRSLAVALDPGSGATAVFLRDVGEETLTFGAAEDALLMIDQETGSVWEKATGQAVDGPMKGQWLQRVPFFSSFWFAWSDFHPETELFTP